ncbi:hypothetical protein [Pseudonocardia sp. NPDC046786]|uniref:hypothetical protein n=1 Tax=Pseudonocardia sp. NPDC046786 TaxID=3155471 RepID=UPI0033F11037
MNGSRAPLPRRRLRGVRYGLAAVVAALMLSGCADQPDPLSQGPEGAAPADGLTQVVELTAQRAGLAGQAALAELDAGAPVPDPGADAAVVQEAAERAGVDRQWVARVVADQVAASAQVRDGLLRQWAERPESRPGGPADPARVRGEFGRIDQELIAALAVAAPARVHEDCPASLAQAAVAQAEGLDDLHRGALGRGLTSVCDGTPD